MKIILCVLFVPAIAFSGIVHVTDVDSEFGATKQMSVRVTTYSQGENIRVEPRPSAKSRKKDDPAAAMMDGTVILSTKNETLACSSPATGRKTCVKTQMFSPMGLATKVDQKKKLTRFDYKKTGKTKTIAGHGCDEYSVLSEHQIEEAGKQVRETTNSVLCIGKVPGVEGMLHLFADREMKSLDVEPELKAQYLAFKKLGYLLEADVKSSYREPGGREQKMGSRLTTVSLETKDLSPSLFEVPKGYEVMDPQAMFPSKGNQMPPGMREMIEKQKKQIEALKKSQK